jgi:hypothetical protein
LKPFDVNAVSSDRLVRRHSLRARGASALLSETLARSVCGQKCSSKSDVRFKDSKARANLISLRFGGRREQSVELQGPVSRYRYWNLDALFCCCDLEDTLASRLSSIKSLFDVASSPARLRSQRENTAVSETEVWRASQRLDGILLNSHRSRA